MKENAKLIFKLPYTSPLTLSHTNPYRNHEYYHIPTNPYMIMHFESKPITFIIKIIIYEASWLNLIINQWHTTHKTSHNINYHHHHHHHFHHLYHSGPSTRTHAWIVPIHIWNCLYTCTYIREERSLHFYNVNNRATSTLLFKKLIIRIHC